MKNFMTALAAIVIAFSLPAQDRLPYWRDLRVTSVGKEAPHCDFMTFTDRETALSGNFSDGRNYRLLNGEWDFVYVDSYKDLPADITSENPRDVDWSRIVVPGNWEVQGFGTAIYTNHPYEFQPRNPQPPQLPEAVPAGVYRREVDIPAEWLDENVYLCLDGAKSGVYVYVNGVEAGYSEDSKSAAEFLLNPYLRAGRNVLTIKIMRWSTGSYLECQDFWRMSGMERDVYLFTRPEASVRDFRAVAKLDDDLKSGRLSLDVMLANGGSTPRRAELYYELLDSGRNRVAEGSASQNVDGGSEQEVRFAAGIDGVKAWSAESPDLYTLLIRCAWDDGEVEYIPYKVGFRRFELTRIELGGREYNVFLVNGQPVKFKGVNLHEHDPRTGHYVDEALMRRDLEIMRRNNINAIRTCHYPQQRRFYELCDELGFYVYCEANIESHGMGYGLRRGATLGNSPEWLDMHMDRTRNMYEQCKNHPSVVIWSLGNEAGNGYNFYRTYQWLKERETECGENRPVVYERAQWEWNSDMFVPQYPSAAWLEKIGASGSDRPVVPSEYSHAMGNSSGNLWAQWQAIYRYPHLQGGFIWDWVDQGLEEHDAEGRIYYTYGGDYGENAPSDGNFLCNGLVNPDRREHPAMSEVKYSYQNVELKGVNPAAGEVEIFNRFYFTPLTAYRLRYTLTADGVAVASGSLPLSAAPQTSERVTVPLKGWARKAGVEYFVNLDVVTTAAEPLVPAGHVVAFDQLALPVEGGRAEVAAGKGPRLSVNDTGATIEVTSAAVAFVVDKNSGAVVSYKAGRRELLAGGFGPRPNFWRAPTDNDYGNGAPLREQVWKRAVIDMKARSVEAEGRGERVAVTVSYDLGVAGESVVCYEVYPSGAVEVAMRLVPAAEQPEIPRVGMRFRVPVAMERVTYFGRGPGENYSDRKAGSMVGLYATTASEMYFPYVRPQENGHRCDVRWFALGERGRGLKVVAGGPMEFNALRNSVEDFDSEEAVDRPYQWRNFSQQEIADRDEDKARNRMRRQHHMNDVVPRDYVEVCVDLAQQGVAGYNSWGDRPLPEHTLTADKTYELKFTMLPM